MAINLLDTNAGGYTPSFSTLFNSQAVGGVLTVLFVCGFMLIANILRRKIRFLRRSLMPTSVIAGLLGLVIKEVIFYSTGFSIFSGDALSTIVYYALPVAFIALCLREKDDYASEFNKKKVKTERVTAVKSGSVIVSTYLMQALVGIGAAVLCTLFVTNFNPAGGLMLPLGYGQGPQQAYATGTIWDKAGYFSAWGDTGAINFGLAIAAFGFLWASIPGIIFVNRAAKRKGIKRNENENQTSGELKSHTVEEAGEVPLSESIDKFTLQICMVGGVLAVTMGLLMSINAIFNATGNDYLINKLMPIIWGFMFIFAALIAILTKVILRRLVKSGIMHRKYPNSYMMNRISGAAFDISITAALFAISVEALGTLWIPILVISTVGGFASIYYLRYLCNYIYKDYKDEAFLAMYGMLTGVIANGMILLREIDNDFSTPAANDLLVGSSAAIVLGLPLLFLIAPAPSPGNLWWITIVIAVYFIALTAYQLGLFKKFRRKKEAAALQKPTDETKK